MVLKGHPMTKTTDAGRAGHTPGPWKVYRATNGLVIGVGDAEGGGVMDPRGGLWLDGPEREANARLIAAAPAMYEALKDLLAVGVINPTGSAHVTAAIERAEAALALAEGR